MSDTPTLGNTSLGRTLLSALVYAFQKLKANPQSEQSEKEKLQSEKEKLQSEKEKLQSEKEKLPFPALKRFSESPHVWMRGITAKYTEGDKAILFKLSFKELRAIKLLLNKLAKDPEISVRLLVAGNILTYKYIRHILAHDEDLGVQITIAGSFASARTLVFLSNKQSLKIRLAIVGNDFSPDKALRNSLKVMGNEEKREIVLIRDIARIVAREEKKHPNVSADTRAVAESILCKIDYCHGASMESTSSSGER